MKKTILLIILLIVCVNVGVLLGYFFSEKMEHIAMDKDVPPNRQVACGPLCLRLAIEKTCRKNIKYPQNWQKKGDFGESLGKFQIFCQNLVDIVTQAW